MQRKFKKKYKKLSSFDRALIMGLIIESIKLNNISDTNRARIQEYVKNNKSYIDLVKNLGFLSSEIFKKQYESLIDNNLGKLIKRGIVKINNEKIYCLTAHGDDLWLKYNKDWFSMPPLNKQFIIHD